MQEGTPTWNPQWQPTTINENMASLGVDHKKKRCFCCGLELSISDTAIELDIYLILELARIWGDFTIASTIITFSFSSFFSHLIVLRYIFLQPSSWARGSCLRVALRHIQLLELYRSLSRHERRWRWTTTHCLNLMRTHSCSINLEANRICAMVYPSNHLKGRWDDWAFVFIRRSFCGTKVSPTREAHISKSAAANTCLSFNWFDFSQSKHAILWWWWVDSIHHSPWSNENFDSGELDDVFEAALYFSGQVNDVDLGLQRACLAS